MNDTETKVDKQAVHEILRLLTCSDLRKNLAEALREGKKLTLSELSEHIGASSPASVHALRELGKEHLIHQDEKRNYSLTNIGEIVVRKLEEIDLAILTLSHDRQFWLDHDLSDIPKSLLDKVGYLADSTVLTSTPTDLFKSFSTLYMLLQNSKEIRAISPIFADDMTTQFAKLAAKNVDIELILTPGVLDATLRTADKKELEKALKKNLKLFKIERQPNFASTVTDYFFILGFFRPEGSFDWSNALLSYTPDALEWGKELFTYYVEKTEPVIL
jgi:predicted transcriptional regulator